MSETTTPQGEVATGITEDQAASELLKKWGATEESDASTESEDAQDEIEDQPEGDGAEVEASEESDEEESGDVEIDVAGEKFKVPAALKEQAQRIQAKAKEVEAGATRKFQEAADLRKAVEARAEQVGRMQQIAQAQADLLADHRVVMKRLAAYEQINVQQLGHDDPAALTRINAEYNQLTSAKARMEQAYQQAVQAMNAQATQAKQMRQQSVHEFASKNIKGWGAESNDRLGEYVGSKGIEREIVLSVLEHDPRFLLVLEDAAYGQKVRSSNPQKAAPKAQTLKPGGSGVSKPASVQKAQQSMERLKRSGSTDDAAMALLARSAIRKR
jgi:hypothetical protein